MFSDTTCNLMSMIDIFSILVVIRFRIHPLWHVQKRLSSGIVYGLLHQTVNLARLVDVFQDRKINSLSTQSHLVCHQLLKKAGPRFTRTAHPMSILSYHINWTRSKSEPDTALPGWAFDH